MAGNSRRQGAVRKSKKGAQVGSGGQARRALQGKGPTPKAVDRKGHPAARRAAAASRRSDKRPGRDGGGGPELLVGRNPVVEALRAKIPATALYVALGIESDERVTEALHIAGDRGLALLEVTRGELDRRTGGLLHQGIALQVPPYSYAELADVLAAAGEATTAPLLLALDGVTDPRNLGAVIRSAAAFGAHGVIIPERRSAAVTAAAWRTSAGTAARVPVAQVTNLVRALKECQKAGLFVVGLDADGDVSLDDLEAAVDPVVVVLGSEGRGLSRLVGETCDLTVSIPMSRRGGIAQRQRGGIGHAGRDRAAPPPGLNRPQDVRPLAVPPVRPHHRAMATPMAGRHTAVIEGDFVVFLIGARFDLRHPVRTFNDLGGRRGMQHMLQHLTEHPEKGLLGFEMGLPTIVQYWRSFDHLEAFANDADDPHSAAWRNYWKRVGKDNRTGIWHETYLVRAGEYEAVYANMPPFGLGKAATLVPVKGATSARGRIKRAVG